MKDFNKLPYEEQCKIVAYTAGNLTIYYSGITELTKDKVIVNGESYNLNGHYELLRAGLTRYEIYKLTMASSEALELLEKTAEAVITSKYEEQFSNVVGYLEKFASEATDVMSKAASNIANSEALVKGTLQDIAGLREILSENTSEINMKAIHDTFKDKMEDVAIARNKFVKELTPTQTELRSLITSLHQIVKPS